MPDLRAPFAGLAAALAQDPVQRRLQAQVDTSVGQHHADPGRRRVDALTRPEHSRVLHPLGRRQGPRMPPALPLRPRRGGRLVRCCHNAPGSGRPSSADSCIRPTMDDAVPGLGAGGLEGSSHWRLPRRRGGGGGRHRFSPVRLVADGGEAIQPRGGSSPHLNDNAGLVQLDAKLGISGSERCPRAAAGHRCPACRASRARPGSSSRTPPRTAAACLIGGACGSGARSRCCRSLQHSSFSSLDWTDHPVGMA